ncbi:MAG: hypothetical protein KJ067_19200 [Vicinamibacteria bacterium]|nr:hypothetical protein [Vicinamibacteria bacterium]
MAPPDPRGAFGGFVGVRTLLSQVESTAPWIVDGRAPRFAELPPRPGPRLRDDARHPLGWWAVLLAAREGRLSFEPTPEPTPEQWEDYFALCLACHWATVATFVPTDVDTKIRLHLWLGPMPPERRAGQVALALETGRWDPRKVTARGVEVEGEGFVSGHDGERLSVLCGGLVACRQAGDDSLARTLEEAVEAELWREARAFEALAARRGREQELLALAALLTHNAGDVDQGLGSREAKRHAAADLERFGDLAGRGPQRYGGAFARAAALYRELLAAEGHRHYPLREIRALRSDPELLLPLGPWLDEWGAKLATWPAWDDPARAEVLAGLVDAARKVRQQQGYYRALAGFDAAFPGGLAGSRMTRALPARVQRELRDSELRKRVAVRRESFESGLAKRAREILARS